MRAWHRLTGTIAALLRRQRLDDDLDEELRAFYAASVEAKLADGMSPREAERAARAEIGSGAAVKDWVRDIGWESRLESVWQDVRYAFRVLWRSPGFSCAAAGTLALGLGATTAMYAVVDAVLVKPFKFDAPERVVELRFRGERSGNYGIGGGALEVVRQLPGVEYVAGTVGTERAIVAPGVAVLAQGEAVTEDFFQIFGVRAALGRAFSRIDRDSGPVVVLSDGVWKRAFGSRADIVGQTVLMSGVPHQVLGVMPRDFWFRPALTTDFWVLRPVSADEMAQRGTGPYMGFARTRTAQLDVVRNQAATLPPQTMEDGQPLALVLIPMLEAVSDFFGRPLWSLLGAVSFVLLLACGNVANLLLARIRQRTPELMVRAAIGAGRGRLVRQLLTESAVVAALAALAGCVVAALLVAALPLLPLTSTNVSRIDGVTIDARVVLFMTCIAFVTMGLIGLVPALSVARRVPTLGSVRTMSAHRGRTSQALVAVEIAATVAMLTGSALVALRVFDLMGTDAGFDLRGLHIAFVRPLGADYDARRLTTFYRAVTDHVRQATGMRAAVIDIMPLDFRRPARVPLTWGNGPAVRVGVRTVSAGAIGFLGAEVRAGREFTVDDRAGATPVALVNESLVAKMTETGAPPLGATLRVEHDGEPVVATVVGVVSDVRQNIYRPPDPEVYLSGAQFPPRRAFVVVRNHGPRAELDAMLRDAVRAADPRQAASEVVAVSDRVRTFTALSRFVAVLMALFAAVAVLLAATGVMAVAAAGVAARTRELGIRMAIGASRADVLSCVASDFLPGVAIGAVVGIAAAASVTNLLRWLEPGVARFDPLVCTGAVMGIFAVAAVGAWFPARRALAIEPKIAMTSVEEW